MHPYIGRTKRQFVEVGGNLSPPPVLVATPLVSDIVYRQTPPPPFSQNQLSSRAVEFTNSCPCTSVPTITCGSVMFG